MPSGEPDATFEEVHAGDAHHVGGGHDHGHASGHDHDEEPEHEDRVQPLGPVDWRAWGAGLLGIGCAAAIGASLYLSLTPA